MKHVSLEGQHESVKQFVLALSSDPDGSVLELGGRAIVCVLPIPDNGAGQTEDSWTQAKNARRCALIDRGSAGG
jgi:hypothetical protein